MNTSSRHLTENIYNTGWAAFAFLDLETTGLYPSRGAKITEIALLQKNETFCYDRDKDKDRNIKNIITLLGEKLDKNVVVGHNLKFDIRFIAYEADRHSIRGPDLIYIDTLPLAKNIFPEFDDFRLENLVRKLCLDVTGAFHNALVDAHAVRTLFWTLIRIGDIGTLRGTGLDRITWKNF